jgi:hypothetical protein
MKNIWIWVAVIVIVLGGIGFFVWQNGGNVSLSTLGNTSLRSLLTANVSQKCTFNNGDSSGTIYVSAGRMRGDFTAKANEEASSQSHMVISNNLAYVWIDGSTQGYRMSFEDITATTSRQSGQGIDADSKVATNCEPWAANDTVFSLPTDVTFNALPSAGTSANSQSQSTTGASAGASVNANAGGDYYAQKCAACNMITDKAAKAECIASFDCPDQ